MVGRRIGYRHDCKRDGHKWEIGYGYMKVGYFGGYTACEYCGAWFPHMKIELEKSSGQQVKASNP